MKQLKFEKTVPVLCRPDEYRTLVGRVWTMIGRRVNASDFFRANTNMTIWFTRKCDSIGCGQCLSGPHQILDEVSFTVNNATQLAACFAAFIRKNGYEMVEIDDLAPSNIW